MSLMQPKCETSPQPLMDPKRPRSGDHTPTEQPPKTSKTPLEQGSYKKSLLSSKETKLLDHPEETLS
jgi:hypothetical protein